MRDVRIVVFHSCTLLRVFLRVIIVVINLFKPTILMAKLFEKGASSSIIDGPRAGWGHWPGRPKSLIYMIVLHAGIHNRDTRMIFSDFIQIPQYEHLPYVQVFSLSTKWQAPLV